MQLNQKQTLSHKLVLAQTLRQSLQYLQCSAVELNELVQEAALSNPLLEVVPAEFYDAVSVDELISPAEQEISFREFSYSGTHSPGNAEFSLDLLNGNGQSFADYLNEQLGQMRLVDDEMRKLCQYLIGCLDRRGYLDCPIHELSEEMDCTAAELEQALYVIQMLEPTGVGARDLSECLVLQLAQSGYFNRLTLAIAQDGLDELAHRDFSALSRKLGAPLSAVRKAADQVLSLNPIPSRGFSSGEQTAYLLPDALVKNEDGKLTLTLNERILPKLSIHADYALLAESSEDEATKQYAKEMLSAANTLVRNVSLRGDTLLRLLNYLLQEQAAFFRGGELGTLTMQKAAEALGVNVSTISRAVQNKYLQFEGRIYPLRDFFSTAIRTEGKGAISVQTLRRRIAYLIDCEDKRAPLSDEDLQRILEKDGISISRRAVAGHRSALGIPFASRRKNDALSNSNVIKSVTE